VRIPTGTAHALDSRAFPIAVMGKTGTTNQRIQGHSLVIDIDPQIEGVSDHTAADAIRQRVRRERQLIAQPDEWRVTVSPSETRGQWDLGMRAPSGWRFPWFTEAMSSELRFDSTVTLDFDPTNSIVGNRNLIRAVAWDPGQALPLWGSFIGSASSIRGMEVEVIVTEENGASLHTRHDRTEKD
jgi:hypothetical protein